MVRRVRSLPSTSLSQREVRNSAAANDTAAPRAKPTPAPISAQRPATSPLAPNTSSASASPHSATGIAIRARRAGRSLSAAQESRENIMGKVLKASSASATGMRATAE